MNDRSGIQLVSTHLAPGGSRSAALLVAEELAARGHPVSIVALYRGPDGATDLPAGLPIRVLVDVERPRASDYVRAAARLWQLMRRSRPSAVLGVLPAANVLSCACAAATGVRRRVACHHSPRAMHRAPMRWLDSLARRAGVFTDVVCVSASVASSISGGRLRGPASGGPHIIPNAIRPLRVRRDRREVRRLHALPPNEPVLCMIGRLSPEKNVLAAIDAACRLRDVRLAIAGDGPLAREASAIIAREGAQDRIRLLGALPHADAIDLLLACDGFVQISHHEGRSLALLEALMAQRPVLASDIPAQREALTTPSGETAGLLCDPDDIGAIATAMGRLAHEPELRQALVRRAAPLADTLDARRMGDAYDALLGGRGART